MSIIGNSVIVSLSPKKILPQFTYSGNYKFEYEKLSNGDYNWELAILSGNNTNLKFTKGVKNIDIFLVGAGKNGSNGNPSGQSITGGKGGDGGNYLVVSNFQLDYDTNYSLTIGTSQGNTTGFGYTTSGASYKSGGAGASMPNITYPTQGSNAGNGTNGVKAFNEENFISLIGDYRYGASGGGGAVYRYSSGYGEFTFNNGAGAITGSGSGGIADPYAKNGADATQSNYGAGGGGGNAIIYINSYRYGNGGLGSPGIIIIRNHR